MQAHSTLCQADSINPLEAKLKVLPLLTLFFDCIYLQVLLDINDHISLSSVFL